MMTVELVVAYLSLISLQFPGRTEKKQDQPQLLRNLESARTSEKLLSYHKIAQRHKTEDGGSMDL